MRDSPRTRRISALALTLLALVSPGAAQEPPESRTSCWPGEPGSNPRDCPPDDPRYSRRWEFRSDIPPEVDRSRMHPKEIELGSIGFSLDRAWQYVTGRDDVVIAVLDSGIRWHAADLTEKLYINAGELPLPQGSDVYDANGDGIFTVSDYADDPRVGDRNGNDLLDPGDLIRAFSDCEDDDGNGYPDDISGYDFFSGAHCGFTRVDNDPDDETDFGHGTGIASTAAAETDNGLGDAGVCPRCRVLPVRIGDSFVVDANQFAQGLVFATRAGASVVASAVGSYNNTPAARSAVDLAYEQGVAIIASAADEFSYHHNYPSTYNHTLYVNAIRYNNGSDYRKASTFWSLNPCTNYGARVWVSVPALSCSSGATSRLAGVAGLIQSAALDAGIGKLHPEELYQLIRLTADDLDNSDPDWGDLRYPARAGFDQLTGYGRLNALAAVRAALDGRIPPMADLGDPRWFAIVSPTRTPTLPIHGSVRIPRAERGTFELAFATGVEPREEDYTTVSHGDVEGERTGILGVLDFTELPIPGGPAPKNREERDRYSVTLRLRVTDDRGLTGEARRSFFLYDDPDWPAHFPIDLGASGEASPLVVDLDGDGADEIVLPTADGMVRIIRWSESGPQEIRAPLDGRPAAPRPWKQASLERESVVRGAAVGDVLGSGNPSIVVASREGKVYAFDAGGQRLDGFPVSIDPERARPATPKRSVESGILTRPVLAELDGKPGLEIIVSALDGHLYVWRKNGRPLTGFPVRLSPPDPTADRLSKIVSTPAVGDIDGDGRPEIVVGSNGLRAGLAGAYAVRAKGNSGPGGPFVPGWDPFEVSALRPDLLPTLATGLHMTPALVDVDHDDDDEVVLYAVTGTALVLVDQSTEQGPVVLQRHSLQPGEASALAGTTFLGGTGSPLLVDTDRDGEVEIYAGLLSMRMLTLRTKPGVPIDVPLALGAWKVGNGEGSNPEPMLTGYPRRMEDLMIWARPAAADVDRDGTEEVLMGSGGYLLHAFSRAGAEADGFPKFTGGWIFSAPAAGDLDGDGRLDVVAVTREGYLFAWEVGPRPTAPAVPADRVP